VEFSATAHLKGNQFEETMRTLSFFAALLTAASVSAQNTYGDISGTIFDKTNNEPAFDASVYTNSGTAVYRANTDVDGRFRISGVPAGQYELFYIFHEDTLAFPQLADVSPDGFEKLDTVFYTNSTDLIEFKLVYDRERLHLKSGVAPEIKLTGKEARLSPVKFDTKALVTSMTSDVKMDSDGELVFRGARAGDVICYYDGVKMNDVPKVPSAAIGYMMVYSGAIPAKYGDTNGGVVVIETLSYTDMWRAWQSSLKTKE
jgi:hypothetical protein